MALTQDRHKLLGMTQQPPCFPLLSREQAILEFNRRVLAQASRADVPLLERLRYVCIVASNIDEFFEVRVPDVLEASVLPGMGVSHDDLTAALGQARELVDRQYQVFNEELIPALAEKHIRIVNYAQRDVRQQAWVQGFFEQQVRPLLVPVGLDSAHPFPQVANKSLNFIVKLAGKDAFGRNNHIAIVKVPRVLPRVIRMPLAVAPGQQAFVLLTSVIRAHLQSLFPGRTVEAFSQFRVTRDSDLDVDEEALTNLRQALRSSLSMRHFGRAVRLEVVSTCPPELSNFLLRQFGLHEIFLYRVRGPVNLGRLSQLIDAAHGPTLRFPTFKSAWPSDLPRHGGMLARIAHSDVVLHHPFESFAPVVEFVREAVNDPQVLAIKQTVYRTGSESELMEQLVEAAQRGKEVLVVVELKARFDEEANINWAERLEAVGAQVVYGIVGLKTHAKMLLLTRREDGVLKRYLHLSTGNYNLKTARLYTDVGYFTADAHMTADADLLFQQLASLTRASATSVIVQAPFHLHQVMIHHLEQVARAARSGQAAWVKAKMNALTDARLITALLEAAQAGAQIDLIVRGACILPPGLPGTNGRIRVRSVVGRFLEHTRVIAFGWGPDVNDEILYLSSADWMTRNMTRRIEVAWPVQSPTLRKRLMAECLDLYLCDVQDAWQQGPQGWYARVASTSMAEDSDAASMPSAQRSLIMRYGIEN